MIKPESSICGARLPEESIASSRCSTRDSRNPTPNKWLEPRFVRVEPDRSFNYGIPASGCPMNISIWPSCTKRWRIIAIERYRCLRIRSLLRSIGSETAEHSNTKWAIDCSGRAQELQGAVVPHVLVLLNRAAPSVGDIRYQNRCEADPGVEGPDQFRAPASKSALSLLPVCSGAGRYHQAHPRITRSRASGSTAFSSSTCGAPRV